LRQTRYQLLAGGALVLTFCLTLYQAASSYNQWTSDYALRNRQAEVSHLSEALKALSLERNPAARVVGYYSLRQLVLQYPAEEGLLAQLSRLGRLTGSFCGAPSSKRESDQRQPLANWL